LEYGEYPLEGSPGAHARPSWDANDETVSSPFLAAAAATLLLLLLPGSVGGGMRKQLPPLRSVNISLSQQTTATSDE
jgi:hypothetical protein